MQSAATVSTPVIFAFFISLVCTLILPFIVILVLALKKRISMIPLLVGAGAFLVSQVVLRIPILNALSGMSWFTDFARGNYVLYIILVGGLSAGLFEETARYIGARFLLKGKTGYKDCISFGLGHGLCEVVLLVGLGGINNILYSFLINTGSYDLIAGMMPAGQAEQLIAIMTGASAFDVYLGIIERISSVCFHVFATVLVFIAVNHKNNLYYIYAVLSHTVLNSGIVFLARVNALLSEIVFLIVAAGLFYLIIRLKGYWQGDTPLRTVKADE